MVKMPTAYCDNARRALSTEAVDVLAVLVVELPAPAGVETEDVATVIAAENERGLAADPLASCVEPLLREATFG